MARIHFTGERMSQAGPAPTVLLWGGRSQARIIHQMLLDQGVARVMALFDASLEAPYFDASAPLFTSAEQLPQALALASHFVVCIGSEHGYARVRVADALRRKGLLRHERAFVDSGASLGDGCVLMPYALVHKFARVGGQCILNTACTVDHECDLGRGVHVMGRAALAGKVRVGDYASIGTNATILPGLSIGEGAIVGAGAVVTKDVAPCTVVAGNPARPTRRAEPRLDGSLQALEALLPKDL